MASKYTINPNRDTHVYLKVPCLINKETKNLLFFIIYQHSVSFTNYMVRHADIVQTFVLLILDSPTILVQ